MKKKTRIKISGKKIKDLMGYISNLLILWGSFIHMVNEFLELFNNIAGR